MRTVKDVGAKCVALLGGVWKPRKLFWGRRDTRWDVYPQREEPQLVAHDWEGFWLPTPSGDWFKSPTSFVLGQEAKPEDSGVWEEVEVTARVKVHNFRMAH